MTKPWPFIFKNTVVAFFVDLPPPPNVDFSLSKSCSCIHQCKRALRANLVRVCANTASRHPQPARRGRRRPLPDTDPFLESVPARTGVLEQLPADRQHHLAQEVVTAEDVAVPDGHPECSALQLGDRCGKLPQRGPALSQRLTRRAC